MRNILIAGDASVDGEVHLTEDIKIGAGACIRSGVQIHQGCVIGNYANIESGTVLQHDVIIGEFAHIGPEVWIRRDTTIGPNVWIPAFATVHHGVKVMNTKDIITIGNIGSREGSIQTFIYSAGKVFINAGCCNQEEEDFLKTLESRHGDGDYAHEYLAALEFVKKIFSIWGFLRSTDGPENGELNNEKPNELPEPEPCDNCEPTTQNVFGTDL